MTSYLTPITRSNQRCWTQGPGPVDGTEAVKMIARGWVTPRLEKNALTTLDRLSIHTRQQYWLLKRNGPPERVWFGLRHTYMYFMHYSEDASTTKFLVIAIWILDTLHISFSRSQYASRNFHKASLLVNLFVVAAVQWQVAVFCGLTLITQMLPASSHIKYITNTAKKHPVCRSQVGRLVTVPIILFLLTHFAFGVEAEVVVLVYFNSSFANNEFSYLPKIKVVLLTQELPYNLTHYSQFSALIPCATALVLVEVLITLSLCILLYDSGSHSAFPRFDPSFTCNCDLIQDFRCRLVVLAELVTLVDNQDAWAMGIDFNIGKLYVNSLLASLNTREYFRSQISGLKPDLAINAVHFGNLPKLSGDKEIPKGGKRHLEVREVAAMAVAAVPSLDRSIGLQKNREV
ncbi:hypothetical protein EV401DRAFT_1883768 [Pisolithus croceorrhizus]|nr:hypothetical protein EV401DRAFT_1883768 [Pisolithus croceorrhizus]